MTRCMTIGIATVFVRLVFKVTSAQIGHFVTGFAREENRLGIQEVEDREQQNNAVKTFHSRDYSRHFKNSKLACNNLAINYI